MDFELAVVNAFRVAFPNATIKGCYFHFTQCLWDNIKSKVGCKVYDTKHSEYCLATAKWLGYFKGLAFVPVHLVPNCLIWLKENKPNNLSKVKELSNFILYFESTWVNGNFPVNMWNHFETDVHDPRTNNHSEGTNRGRNRLVGSNKPCIYTFIDSFKNNY